MQLQEYPKAIAQLQTKLNSLNFLADTLQRGIKLIEAEVDAAIAFDSQLTNDAKRKAKRTQLLDEYERYWELIETLATTKGERELKAIEHEQRRNEFTVLKLEARERIATLEAANSY